MSAAAVHRPGGAADQMTPADLPDLLPIFPLDGVLLLPRGRLPLNIFEPRYLAMVDDALKSNRLIGMIQPRAAEPGDAEGAGALYATGCAGRIVGFEETEDGRNRIVLAGLCRFRLAVEETQTRGYRRVRPDWTPYLADFKMPDTLGIERAQLKTKLERYFAIQDLSCDWDAIDDASDDRLITCLSMICPFDPGEKQALLEAKCCRDRAAKFMSLLDIANSGNCTAARH